LSAVRSRYLCWWCCWNCAPQWKTQNAYPTGNTQQKTLWHFLALQNHAHFQQSRSVQHESENMDNTTINAEQNHWEVQLRNSSPTSKQFMSEDNKSHEVLQQPETICMITMAASKKNF